MTTLLVIAAIVLTFAYIAYLQNMITRKDDTIGQWVAYADQIEASYADLYSEADYLLAELNEIQRKYGYAITSLKIAGKVLPVERVKYTIGNNTAKPQTKIATQIALFDQTELFNGEFVPEFDQDGLIIYSPKIATNGNGHTTESEANSETQTTQATHNKRIIAGLKSALETSINDKGAFSASEPDYKALAAKYKDNAKYKEFMGKINKAHKGNRTQNQTNYLLAKFDQWENKPNTTDEYCKRVTSEHMNKNK